MAEPLKYAVIVERTPIGYSAYVPDLPGCVTAAETEDLVRTRMQQAIEFHLRSMREDGDPIPEPTTTTITVEVAA